MNGQPSKSPKLFYKASLTVEASFVLPIFFFAFLIFLYFIQILCLQVELQGAMAETAENISQYAFAFDKLKKENQEGLKGFLLKVADDILIKEWTFNNMDKKGIEKYPILKGQKGFHFELSGYDTSLEELSIIVYYQIRLPILWFSTKPFLIRQQVKIKGFTGYSIQGAIEDLEGEKEDKEDFVYMTETGKVYHRKEDCSYLKLSVREIRKENIENIRNHGGGKYYFCELCWNGNPKETERETVYITSFGNRYHSSLTCRGLKRIIKQILLQQAEAEGYLPCSKCGKESR